MPRFVILEHDHPVLHWDLMLESGPALRTWRLAGPPESAGGAVAAKASFDHRLAYLDYEGPVSRGRGTVRRWDQGTYLIEEEAAGRRVKRQVGFGLLGIAGLALVGLTGLGFKDRFLTPEAESAVIEAPIFRVRATGDGILEGREITDLLRRGDIRANVRLEPGDVIIIPESMF